MPAERKHCKAQILRMSGLRRYPLTDEGLREAIDALQRWAVTDQHATKVVDEWIEDSPDFPTPAQIRAVAVAHRPAARNPSADCPECGGAGSVRVVIWRDGVPYDCAKICGCRSAAVLA